MNRGERLIRGSAVKICNFLLGVVISFYLMPFLIKSLGDSIYGVWTLVGEFLGYYGLLDIGLSSAVVRFISRAVGRREDEEVRKTFCTSFYLFLAMGLMTVTLTCGLALSLSHFMKAQENIRLFRILLFMMGVNFALDFPIRSYNAILTSNLREDIGTSITFIKTICNATGIVLTVRHGYGIVGLAAVTIGFSILDSIARVVVAYRLDPRISISPAHFDRTKFRPLFNYSAFAFVGRIANILRFRLDQIVISACVGFGSVTHYYVATRLIDYLQSLISQMIGVITPMFSQDEGLSDFHAIRWKFLFVSKISTYVSVFFCGVTFFYGGRFIDRWMGPGFGDAGVVLWIFLIPFTLHLIQAPMYPLLDGISKHRYYAIPNFVEGLFNLGLSLWLVRSYGMIGVAVGTAVPMTLKLLTVQPWYACRSIDLPLKAYLSETFRDLFYSGALLVIGWYAARPYAASTYPALIKCVIVQTAIYWPLASLVGFNQKEKNYLFDSTKRALRLKRRVAVPVEAIVAEERV